MGVNGTGGVGRDRTEFFPFLLLVRFPSIILTPLITHFVIHGAHDGLARRRVDAVGEQRDSPVRDVVDDSSFPQNVGAFDK